MTRTDWVRECHIPLAQMTMIQAVCVVVVWRSESMRRGERCDKPLSSSSSASSIIIRFHEYSMSYSSERRRKKVENDANIVDLTFTVNLFPHMARFGPSAFHIWFLPCHSRPPQISPWTLKSPFVISISISISISITMPYQPSSLA